MSLNERKLAFAILILLLCLVGVHNASGLSQPMQIAEYDGVISWSPNPPYSGATESFWVEIRNVGTVLFKVTNLELGTDWAVGYYFTDVPQIIDVGSSYKFGPVSIPIPSSVSGSHNISAYGSMEIMTSAGTWSQDYEKTIGSLYMNIESSPVITGPTTISMPTEQMTCDQTNCYAVMQGTTLATLPLPQPVNNGMGDVWWFVGIFVFGVIVVLAVIRISSSKPKKAVKPKVVSTTVYCINCGYENPVANEFCGKCGQPLLPSTSRSIAT